MRQEVCDRGGKLLERILSVLLPAPQWFFDIPLQVRKELWTGLIVWSVVSLAMGLIGN